MIVDSVFERFESLHVVGLNRRVDNCDFMISYQSEADPGER
jgi:hypothetical protein